MLDDQHTLFFDPREIPNGMRKKPPQKNEKPHRQKPTSSDTTPRIEIKIPHDPDKKQPWQEIGH